MSEFKKKGREKNLVEGEGVIERIGEGLGVQESENRKKGFFQGLLDFFSLKKEGKEQHEEK